MIPVLIVDDEAAIRESIASMLLTRYPATFAIEQAENGQRAVEFACSQPVSLILADIKMPVLTGLEMLERLAEVGYEGEVIVVSGFDDYALVRRAMKLGASDYLLKPIVADDFYLQIDGFLMRYRNRMPAARPAAVSSPQQRSYRQQYALEHLLRDSGRALENLMVDCHLNAGHRLVVCALATGSAPQNALLRQAWQAEWEEATAELLKDGCVLIQGEWQHMMLTLFFYLTPEQLEAFRTARRMQSRRCAGLVFSRPVAIDEAAQALEECRQLLTRRFYDLEGEDGPEQFPYAPLFSQMTDAMCRLDAGAFDAAFSLLMRRVCAQLPPPEQLRQLLCAMIYAVLQRNSAFIRVVGRMELTQDDAVRCIQGAASARDLSRELTRIVHLQIEKVTAQSASRDELHIERAKQFIYQHHAQDLTLAAVAEHLALNPNYVSTLFTKACGIPYSHYLRRVRIEEACRLIRETNEKLYAIGERVGYHDPAQFNRAFREEMHCSPREYKKASSVH